MPQTIPIRAVHHVGRLTKRLEASKAFYCDVLGFREIERPNFDFPGAWLFAFGVQIHLIGNEAAGDPAGEIQSRVNHLAMHVDDFEQARTLLEEHGIEYRESQAPGRDLRQLFFRDPDGHVVELATYPPTPDFI